MRNFKSIDTILVFLVLSNLLFAESSITAPLQSNDENLVTIPTAYTVTGGGSFCAGGSGVAIGLSGSQVGVTYQLYLGNTAVGTAVNGTGSAISFGGQLSAGTYTVVTTGSGSQTMSGSATITVNALPIAYNLTGGGSYCSGGSGVLVSLSNSQVGVSYQLYLNSVAVGTSVAGTGTAISFGNKTSAGTYTVVATNGSGCTQSMSGSAVITIISLPTSYTVTGGGSYCTGSGGLGLSIGLNSSDLGVSYRLYQGGVAVGSSVSGTGSAISFGSYLQAGTYSVIATNGSGCTRTMSNSVSITINSLPSFYNVTGGGSYCSSGIGVPVGLSGSQVGVSYRLFQAGVAVSASVVGTGSAISFGNQIQSGVYTVVGTNVSGCSQGMIGSASVTIDESVPTFISSAEVATLENTNVTYTTQENQTNYNWTISGASGIDYSIVSGGISTASNTVTLKWLTQGSKTVTVNYTNLNGCVGRNPATSVTQVSLLNNLNVIGNNLSLFSTSSIIREVEVFDTMGKKVLSTNAFIDKLDISTLKLGVYILKITFVNKRIESTRFVVM